MRVCDGSVTFNSLRNGREGQKDTFKPTQVNKIGYHLRNRISQYRDKRQNTGTEKTPLDSIPLLSVVAEGLWGQ